MSQLIDLSHTITDGMITYKGLPAPIICDYLSREDSLKNYGNGASFQIGKIEMVSNTGTYIDCPFHRYENGKDLSEFGLGSFVDLPAVKVQVSHKESLSVDISAFVGLDLKGKGVLIQTDWSDYWGTDAYFENHAFLSEEAAEFLKDSGVVLVGIDSHNIDDTRTNTRPIHTLLLGAEILIVEHMTNLAQLPSSGFTFSAVPPKIKGMGTFPVRAFAKID